MKPEDVKAGMYYRRRTPLPNNYGPPEIVKVLHEEVYPYGGSKPSVVFRYRTGEWPTRAESIGLYLFVQEFVGPLDWDTALKEFK